MSLKVDNWVPYFVNWGKRKTVNVFKTRRKFFSTCNTQTQNPISPIYIPHIQDSTLQFRPLQRTLPLKSRKYLCTPQPWVEVGLSWDGWQEPTWAVGRKLPVRPTATPVSLRRSCEHWRAMIPTTLCCCLRLPGEKLPPEVYEYFREIKLVQRGADEGEISGESGAGERWELSQWLWSPLASLRYLYWEMNHLLSTCQVPGRLQVSWGFPFNPYRMALLSPLYGCARWDTFCSHWSLVGSWGLKTANADIEGCLLDACKLCAEGLTYKWERKAMETPGPQF